MKPFILSLNASAVPTSATTDAIFLSFAFATLVFAASALFPLRISVWSAKSSGLGIKSLSSGKPLILLLSNDIALSDAPFAKSFFTNLSPPAISCAVLIASFVLPNNS